MKPLTPIPELYAQGVPLKEIARQYNTSIATACKIAQVAGLSRTKGVTRAEIRRMVLLSDISAEAAGLALGISRRRAQHIRDYHMRQSARSDDN